MSPGAFCDRDLKTVGKVHFSGFLHLIPKRLMSPMPGAGPRVSEVATAIRGAGVPCSQPQANGQQGEAPYQHPWLGQQPSPIRDQAPLPEGRLHQGSEGHF